MKAIKTIFIVVMLLGLSEIANAQAIDKVIMLNGETKEGKVTADNGSAIKFVYKGETLEYEVKKSDINKIAFASGRVETINDGVAKAKAEIAAPGERKGKIAVLPTDYSTNEGNATVESMRLRIQTDAVNSIKQNTRSLQVQDPITTNALLAKNNIKADQLMAITPHDLAIALGVEFVLYTSVSITNKGSYSYGSGSTTYNNKKTTNDNGNKSTTKNTGSDYTVNSSSTIVQYETHVNLSMYNDQGSSLYAESRQAFGSGIDAYTASLNYLIKRCPFGSKAIR